MAKRLFAVVGIVLLSAQVFALQAPSAQTPAGQAPPGQGEFPGRSTATVRTAPAAPLLITAHARLIAACFTCDRVAPVEQSRGGNARPRETAAESAVNRRSLHLHPSVLLVGVVIG